MNYKVGIDVGGTKVNIGVIDKDGFVLGKKRLLISNITNFVSAATIETKTLLKELGIDKKDVSGCGVGVPGTVRADQRTLVKIPNLSILPENLADELEKELGISVRLVQDAKGAGYGEYVFGAGKGAKALLCFTLGTGIGMGIVLNGEIYQGGLGSAGEIGHIPLGKDRKCGCGKVGCVEKYSAGGGLDITARELLGDGQTATDLFESAKQGNQKAKEYIAEAVKMLGTAITSAVNLFSPDVVLFSGGLSERYDEYVKPIIEFVKEHCYDGGALPRFELAKLGSDAPLIGSASIAD